jgi:hypothetical protein
VEDGTRVRWARLASLIVIINCCHSWCPPGSRVSSFQIYTLQGGLLIQISVTPLDMGDACSSSPNVEMFKLHLMMYDNFKNVNDYLVVMAYDNHIVFDTFACLD